MRRTSAIEAEVLAVTATAVSRVCSPTSSATPCILRINNSKVWERSWFDAVSLEIIIDDVRRQILRGLMEAVDVPQESRSRVARVLSAARHTAFLSGASIPMTAPKAKGNWPASFRRTDGCSLNCCSCCLSSGAEAGWIGDTWDDFKRYLISRVGIAPAVAEELKAVILLPPNPGEACMKLLEVPIVLAWLAGILSGTVFSPWCLLVAVCQATSGRRT
jgi:hypothetical protein